MEFPVVKLLDYAGQWAVLEKSNNPFAVVVMAHLKAQETRRYPKNRLRWKIELIKGLYARGWKHANIWELFRFLDWIMVLPEPLELQFEKAVAELEETEKMRYVTHLERRAKAEGIKEGIKEGLQALRETISEVLTLRFGEVPPEMSTQLSYVTDLEQLKALHRQAVLAGALEEFEQLLETTLKQGQDAA